MEGDDKDVPFWWQPNPYEQNEGCAIIGALAIIGLVWCIFG